MNRKIGLAFAQDKGLTLQVYACMDDSTCWEKCVSFADIESNRTASLSIPRTSGWLLIIPAYQCIVRYAVLPSADPQEIEKMLDFELPNIAPYNTQPWIHDFSLIGKQEAGASNISVVLSPSSIIEGYMKALSSLKITPDVVIPSAMFYATLLYRNKMLENTSRIGYFCLTGDRLVFFAIENEQVNFFRGVQLKKKFCEDLRFVEAEVQRTLLMLKEYEVISCPKEFFVLNTKKSPADFPKIVQKALGAAVEVIGSFDLYDENSAQTDSSIAVSSYDDVLCLLKKSQINLLPKHLKEKCLSSNRRRYMILHVLKVCVVLFMVFLCLKVSIWRKNCLLERYEQRLAAISPVAEKLQFLRQQLSIIQNQLTGKVSTLDIILELYKVLPKDITVHYLNIEQNKKVVMRAQAKLLSQAFECISLLEQSGYFNNVRQSYANQRQIENNVLIDFEIRADLSEGALSGDKQ